MVDYRLYCLDGAGKIGFAHWIEADTDDEALTKARELKPDSRKCEVWQETRLVAKLNGQGCFERP
jgi:hypothetical protein